MKQHILRCGFCLTVLVCILICSAAALDSPAIGIGIVTTQNGLYVRNAPSTSGEIIACASLDDALVVLDQQDAWYHVLYNLEEGYVHSDYVKFKERENVELGLGKINAARVNLRSGPGTDYPVSTSMIKDASARIIGFNCGWYKVIYQNVTAYVRSDLMDLTEKPLENSDGYGYSRVTAQDGSLQSAAIIVSDAPAAAAPAVTTAAATVADNATANALVEFAKTLKGCPYVFGGTTTAGFDCSGFVQYVYKQYGYSLNRTANDQMKNGVSVTVPELQPGDIVFFGYNGYSNHSGIYIGNNQFIHAANSNSGVVITSLYVDYYCSSYMGARRIIS